MNSVCKTAVALGLAGLLAAPVAVANETGFEFGVSGLSTHMDATLRASKQSFDVTRVSDHSDGWALNGAWRFSPHFAVDVEYADHGSFHGFNTCPPEVFCIAANIPERVKAETWTLSMIGEMPISDSWRLFGRLGWAETELDRQFARDLRDDGVSAGAGVRWAWNDMSSLSLEYRDEAAKMDRVGLQLSYKF
jgi:hypothetical protein